MPAPFQRDPRDRAAGPADGTAWFAGVRARGVLECIDVAAEPERLTAPGFWAVVGEFDGPVRAWRFAEVERDARGAHGRQDDAPAPAAPGTLLAAPAAWHGPDPDAWTTSLDRAAYEHAVEEVRAQIRAGEVYQANICRVLSAPLPAHGGTEPDAGALAAVLAAGNPAPYAGGLHVPAGGGVDPVWVVTASPELYLRLDGDTIVSGPIKGTAPTPAGLTAKDAAENVMITDLVRNDLQQVSVPGTVEVTQLLGVEEHPGLVHLVSTVQGRLAPDVRGDPALWGRLLAATYPPGSVSGAPKRAALRIIGELETAPRGPYCGAVGWVEVGDDGQVRAELAVGIRTFWWRGGVLRFGTGAGITWGSDAADEWRETELKARRLIALASGGTGAPGGPAATLAR
ncbi:chorismate-binding protein [Cellulomonas hominis]